jgi:hypothetical protein
MYSGGSTTEFATRISHAGNGTGFISSVRRWSWVVFVITMLFQLLFHWSLVNLMCISCVALGWSIVTRIFLRTKVLNDFPLSTLVIMAFAATQLYFPQVFTSLEGKSLIHNLELPEEIFLHTIAALIVLTLVHYFYRTLSRISGGGSRPIMTKIGLFDPPSDLQLWFMGFIGIAAGFYIYFLNPDMGREVTGSAVDKLIQGLVPFSYAPYFILIGKMYGKEKVPSLKKYIFLLLIFTIILFALSISRNSRGAFMIGFTSTAFGYILGLLMGVFSPRIFTFRNIAVAAFAVWLLVGPIADLGTAMVIVRGDREEVPPAELLEETIDTFWDKEAIRARRMDDISIGHEFDWDERYLDNIFTARFANIKFNDMSLIQYHKIGEYDPDMLSHSLDYLVCALPEPLAKKIDDDVDKDFVYGMSMGDFLYLIAGGQGYIEGYRTGSFAGTGMATFSWWYLLILGIGMIPVFFLFDLLTKKVTIYDPNEGATVSVRISLCALLSMTKIFQFIPFESVVSIGTFLVRGWIQMVVLYLAIFHVTRILSGARRQRKSRLVIAN